MTIKEFEYIRDNWDICIPSGHTHFKSVPNTFQLYPFELYLINGIRPEGDCFVSIPVSDFRDMALSEEYRNSEDKAKHLLEMIESGAIKRVRISHRKVQRIQGYTKGRCNVKKWNSSDWKSEVRNDILKNIGI